MLRFFNSVMNGIVGIGTAVEEQNMRLHLFAAVLVICFGFGFRLSANEWAIVCVCIGGVLAMECMNTAIERLSDRVTTEQEPLIKQAKDVAAAGVLITAIASAVVGGIVFGPKLMSVLSAYSQ